MKPLTDRDRDDQLLANVIEAMDEAEDAVWRTYSTMDSADDYGAIQQSAMAEAAIKVVREDERQRLREALLSPDVLHAVCRFRESYGPDKQAADARRKRGIYPYSTGALGDARSHVEAALDAIDAN